MWLILGSYPCQIRNCVYNVNRDNVWHINLLKHLDNSTFFPFYININRSILWFSLRNNKFFFLHAGKNSILVYCDNGVRFIQTDWCCNIRNSNILRRNSYSHIIIKIVVKQALMCWIYRRIICPGFNGNGKIPLSIKAYADYSV